MSYYYPHHGGNFMAMSSSSMQLLKDQKLFEVKIIIDHITTVKGKKLKKRRAKFAGPGLTRQQNYDAKPAADRDFASEKLSINSTSRTTFAIGVLKRRSKTLILSTQWKHKHTPSNTFLPIYSSYSHTQVHRKQ